MYLLHQFEEHGVDLLGRRFAFLADLCATLGHVELSSCPADPEFLCAVNAVGCQIAFAMSLVFRRRSPLVAACAWGVPLVNGVIHVGTAVAHGAYNPGALTSLILFLPLCAWMLRTVVWAGVVSPSQVLRVVATGVVVHVVLLASLQLHERGWISHGAMLAINMANGLWPLAFGAQSAKRAARAPMTA
jgi:hypothetical protein